LWFSGNKEEGLFTATWVPSILCFGIYFNVLALKGGKKWVITWFWLLAFSARHWLFLAP